MSATEEQRQAVWPAGAPWRDPATLRAIGRRHATPLGLALLVGSLLRLIWLNDTSFLGDQAQLLAVGRSAADHHAFILTGIPSSIGTLNAPVSTWLYGPFSIIGGPLGAAIFTALANIAAIVLMYAICARYLSRFAGFAAATLYATASGPVHYARFVWQQNLLPPVLLLFFFVMLRAIVERRQGWLGWSVLLWGMATSLHPTAAPLLGLIVLAVVWTWRDLRRRDILWVVAALALLLGPNALWEIISHGADVIGAIGFANGKPQFDTWAISLLLDMISPAPPHWLGVSSDYTQAGQALGWLGALVRGLFIVAQAWMLGFIVLPLARRLQRHERLVSVLDDARWRFTACLALWEALPLAFMLRHTRVIVPHYLLVILPAAYIGIGAFLAWTLSQAQMGLRHWRPLAARWQGAALGALAAVVIFISAAQTVGVWNELATIHSGRFDALALPFHHGTPLSSEAAVISASQSAARRLHATLAIASTQVEQEPLGYLSATSGANLPATDYVSNGCVVLPAADAQAPLLTLVVPTSTAASLLPSMPGARLVQTMRVQGGPPYQLYELTPGTGLANEQAITATIPNLSALTPAAYSYLDVAGSAPTLAIRWTGAPARSSPGSADVRYWYGADPAGAPLANYVVTAQALDAQGRPLGAPITSACSRLQWPQRTSLVTTLVIPTSLASGRPIAAWRVSMSAAPATASRFALGLLTLETGFITFGPARQQSGPVTFAAPLT